MTDGSTQAPAVPPAEKARSERDEDLRRFDIMTEERTIYLWNGYRYSNAGDAIAAAKRACR